MERNPRQSVEQETGVSSVHPASPLEQVWFTFRRLRWLCHFWGPLGFLFWIRRIFILCLFSAFLRSICWFGKSPRPPPAILVTTSSPFSGSTLMEITWASTQKAHKSTDNLQGVSFCGDSWLWVSQLWWLIIYSELIWIKKVYICSFTTTHCPA